ncbi:hypothetical protein ACWD4L_46245 [Streptomyces sp. NPDC002596]
MRYFPAGDATYDEDLLRRRIVDGPTSDLKVAVCTLEAIAVFARREPTVLLPANGPFAEVRLAEGITLSD